MKRVIQETIEKSVDVEMPCYVKNGDNHFTKVLDDKTAMIVKSYSFSYGIEIVSLDQYNPFTNGWQFVGEDDFNIAKNKVIELLKIHVV